MGDGVSVGDFVLVAWGGGRVDEGDCDGRPVWVGATVRVGAMEAVGATAVAGAGV